GRAEARARVVRSEVVPLAPTRERRVSRGSLGRERCAARAAWGPLSGESSIRNRSMLRIARLELAGEGALRAAKALTCAPASAPRWAGGEREREATSRGRDRGARKAAPSAPTDLWDAL